MQVLRGQHEKSQRLTRQNRAIVEPCRFLERLGARVSYLPVDGSGRIDPDDLRKAITPANAKDPLRTVRGAGYAFDETFART